MQTLEQRIEAIEAKLGIVVDAPQTSAPIKDWEIVAFKNHYSQIFIKKENGCFCRCNWTEHQMINGHPKMAASIANGKLSIHFVRRLSDDITLTVGQNTNRGIIQRFTIKDECMFVKCDSTVFEYQLNIVEPDPATPSFTFTTHDGVVITDPEQVVYSVSKQGDFTISSHDALSSKIQSEKYDYLNLFFSTESARDEYRVLNSRCLSIQDVLTKLQGLADFEISILENLVQSRLK